MEEINLDELFKHNADNSKELYIRFISEFTLEDLADSDKTIKYIETRRHRLTGEPIMNNTKMTFFKLVRTFLGLLENNNILPDIFKKMNFNELKDEYYKKIEEYKKKYAKECKDEKLKITYEELEELLMKPEYYNKDYFVPLYLHFKYPVRTDYRTVKINNYDYKNDNYIKFKKKHIIFKGRMKNTPGTTIMLSKEDWKCIGEYITKNKKEGQEYLLIQKNKNQLSSSSSYAKYIKRCCNQIGIPELTTTDFRKISDTYFWRNAPSNEEIERQCETQGHGIKQSFSVYRK